MIVTSDRVYHLQAENKKEMQHWMEVLQKVINITKNRTNYHWKKKNHLISEGDKQFKEGYLQELTIFKTWKQYYFILKVT